MCDLSQPRDLLTYRHPRSLLEAFGCDAQTAYAIEGPYRSDMEGLFGVLLAVVIGLLLAWGLYHWFAN